VHKYSARSSVSFTVLNLLTHTVRQLWIGTPTAMMASILEKCAGARRQRLLPGAILLSEGETSGRLYVLAEGSIEVLRGNTQVALIAEPGAIFGEMSVLLNRPHTATVKAASKACVFVFDNAERFLKSNPEIAFLLGRLLAERLNAATTYLVDLKRQFEGHTNHLGMVGEVLESLIHQQHETITLDPEREADPRL
jgi:CRP-like cAMP-binding protein